jgi:hypothetical protein
MQTIIKIFPKTHRFFTISFNQANDVYVKIYETTQLTTFYVANVLWVAFFNSVELITTREINIMSFLVF